MKQFLIYTKSSIAEHFEDFQGIRNIDLSNVNKCKQALNNILSLLDLEDVLQLEDVEKDGQYIRFALQLMEGKTKIDFTEAINKLQDVFKTSLIKTRNRNASDIFKDIQEINRSYGFTSYNGHILHVGLTDKSEEEIKLQYNLPYHLLYLRLDNLKIASDTYNLFIRNDYLSETTSQEPNLFIFATRSDKKKR